MKKIVLFLLSITIVNANFASSPADSKSKSENLQNNEKTKDKFKFSFTCTTLPSGELERNTEVIDIDNPKNSLRTKVTFDKNSQQIIGSPLIFNASSTDMKDKLFRWYIAGNEALMLKFLEAVEHNRPSLQMSYKGLAASTGELEVLNEPLNDSEKACASSPVDSKSKSESL